MDMLKWAALLIVAVVGALAAYQYFWTAGMDTMYESHYGSAPPDR